MPNALTPSRKSAAGRGAGRAPLLALATGAGLAAALLAYLVLARQTQGARAVPPVPVVVAARDLPPRRPLTAGMLAVRRLPPSQVPDGAASTVESLVGEVTTQGVAAGQPVTRAAVAARDSLPGLALSVSPRLRAVGVPLDPASGDPGFLEPGDRVDVLATFDAGGGQAVTRLIVQDARLLAIGARTAATPPDTPAPSGPASGATLEVTPRAAQALALASARGRLLLTLRGLDDDAQTPTPDLPSAAVTGAATPPPPIVAIRPVPEPPVPVVVRPIATAGLTRQTRPLPTPPTITVIRGTQATTMTVGQ